MLKLSAVIITYNEEKYIEQCLNSLKGIADEIVVVDSLSTDKTEEICLNFGVKFTKQPFLGYREQKNFACQQAENDYILSLDADEALSSKLREEILKLKAKEKWYFDGYSFNRLNNYCGQWMHHTAYYPDRKIRLFNRNRSTWGGINPHDKIVLKPGSKLVHVKGDILHWVIDSYEDHINKINKFSTISARSYKALGKKSGIAKILFDPPYRFIRSYFFKLGILEGFNGFVVSVFSAYSGFLKYSKLRRLMLDEKNKKS